MSATQRQSRRKTARHFFDDDEEPPAKRSKVESATVVNGTNKAVSSKPAAPRTKKARTAYDEDADGFTFARKTRSKKATDEPVPVNEPQASTTRALAEQKTAKRSDSKADSRVPSNSSEAETQPRRRSARLSGDKEQLVKLPPAQKATRKRKSVELKTNEPSRDRSPEFAQPTLQVEKKRDGTKIALPFADTPIINRNKEMRAAKGKAPNRRSSVSSRGRRASSLIENGNSNALPHPDVDVADFYKHIEHSLIEPKRMRQLLTWSGTRALPPKTHGGHGDANETFTLEAARSITEDLLKDFSNKPEMSDWFSREDTAGAESTAIVKRPNPRNAQNRARLEKLEEEIARLKEEEKQWNELVGDPKSKQQASDQDSDTIDAEALDPEQAAILAEIQPDILPSSSHHQSQQQPKPSSRRKSKAKATDAIETQPTTLATLSTRLQQVNTSLEPQIDLFADGIHRIGQYRLAAERVADAILGTTARKLELREKEATGEKGVDGMTLLKALGQSLYSQGEGR